MASDLPPTGLAPIIVSAWFGQEDFAWLDGLRQAHFPPERNHIAAHLTLFHHLAPSLAGELRTRLTALTRGVARPEAWVTGVMPLGGGTALRVEAPGLAAARAELAEAFAGMLTPQDAAGWRPHVTVQNKVSGAAARALQAELAPQIGRRPLTIAGLAAYWYRGGPWEPLSRHMYA